ncbi:MAG: hypothetical protein RMY64_26085 [Nostoc sp. DedQUE08]|nr:hypothetical protein [Nostoc sp. DedQUE08]
MKRDRLSCHTHEKFFINYSPLDLRVQARAIAVVLLHYQTQFRNNSILYYEGLPNSTRSCHH